jgi:hypothetical protein
LSGSSPIAAITESLWRLLDRELSAVLPGVKVSACPPDRVRNEAGGRRINLYLCQISEDTTRRNAGSNEIPRPLVLTLRYLVSVYGDDGDGVELSAHEVLGEAMRILHEHSVTPVSRHGGDPQNAPALHIALQAVSLDDMNKLWGSWQTPYRTSVVYDVSAAVLNSRS